MTEALVMNELEGAANVLPAEVTVSVPKFTGVGSASATAGDTTGNDGAINATATSTESARRTNERVFMDNLH
jgi:hypothetical protein